MSRLSFAALGRAVAGGVLAGAACLMGAAATTVAAAPGFQTGGIGGTVGSPARISYVRVQGGGGVFSRAQTVAYVQMYDKADPPVLRTALTGLPTSAFSATEDGKPVALTIKPVAADEPVAMVVIADTSNDRQWLPPGPKYADPMLYLRDAATKVLKEFPENGRYALYTMNGPATGLPALADRTSALNAAAQLQPSREARLLERLDRAVEALSQVQPEWRRIVVVLSDGNSAFGRNYELIAAAANKAHVAVFSVGTIDHNQAFPFVDWLGQETGGQSWLFEKADLQPQPTSPVLLDLLTDQLVKAIKSAYRLEYAPPDSGKDARELAVTVKAAPTTEAKSKAVTYEARFGPGPGGTIALVAGAVVVLAALGAGAFYYLRLRPVKTDYFLIGHGPSQGHIPEEYLYTNWRPLGRGGRGYQLKPEDPHFAGISRTHVFLRVSNWRRVRAAGGHEQTVGTVEVHAGKPSTGVGLNTAFVYNELTGLRVLSERPFQLQTGDLLILQGGAHTGQGPGGLPQGVYLRLGYVSGTTTEGQPSGGAWDADKTMVETVVESDRTVVEQSPIAPAVAGMRPPNVPPLPPNGSPPRR